MRKKILLIAVAVIGLFSVSTASAETQSSFSEAQRAEIEQIVKTYLTEKDPEVLATGLRAYQEKEQQMADGRMKDKIKAERKRIYDDPTSPTVGNSKAKVTIVEFFDYACGYCRVAGEAVVRVLKEDKNVRMVFKHYPVLGALSVEAAKASLASVKQGKFYAFHAELMTKKGQLTSEMIYETAKESGLDVQKLKKDMEDESVIKALESSMRLGQDLGVRGTPFFMVNDSVFPGVMNYDQLKDVIDEARKSKSR